MKRKMPEKQLFEYAVIRVVPRVEREEFMNVGIIVYSQKNKFLQSRFHIDNNRLKAFSDETDATEIEEHLRSFERICKGGKAAGPIGELDLASRFRWLTATRSTIVQVSKVHPGFCCEPAEAVDKLFKELVL
jgi:hypothetical protein